jgi:hypothetical protein
MIERSLAHSSTEETTAGDLEHVSGIAQRVLRGQRLFKERAAMFLHKRGAWFVPSENGIGYYAVRLGPVETCECANYEHRGGQCKHIVSASIAHAKSGVCSCCGHRVLNRFLSEVAEDDDLLGWFVGDMLCADCVKAGYWA